MGNRNRKKFEYLQKQIGYKIKAHREAQNMTQADLAKITGISNTYICQIENGRSNNISLSTLFLIVDALNVDITEIIYYTDLEYGVDREYDMYSQNNKEDATETLLKETKILNSFYPVKFSNHKITSLMEFLLYLPLMDEYWICDTLNRIGGEVIHREDYICDLLDKMVDDIPESPAKRYADKQADLIDKKRKNNLIAFECEDREGDDFGYDEYMKIVKGLFIRLKIRKQLQMVELELDKYKGEEYDTDIDHIKLWEFM